MIVLLGAIEGEVNLLRTKLNEKNIQFTKSKEPQKIMVRSCGIGNLAAAISFFELKIEHPDISEVIFLGSAGAYNDKKHNRIYSIHFKQIDLAVAEGRGKKPELMSTSIETEMGNLGSFLSDKLGLTPGTINSPDSITLVTTDSFPPDTYENMEAFGLAYVAVKMKIPFTCIAPITNIVCPSGSDEWRKNYRIMSETLQTEILNLLGMK